MCLAYQVVNVAPRHVKQGEEHSYEEASLNPQLYLCR